MELREQKMNVGISIIFISPFHFISCYFKHGSDRKSRKTNKQTTKCSIII